MGVHLACLVISSHLLFIKTVHTSSYRLKYTRYTLALLAAPSRVADVRDDRISRV